MTIAPPICNCKSPLRNIFPDRGCPVHGTKATHDRLVQAEHARDHWKNVSRRLLADLDAIRRNIERFEDGLTVEDFEATITADDAHLIGWCRVLCEVALQDHAGEVVPRVDPAAPQLSSGGGA